MGRVPNFMDSFVLLSAPNVSAVQPAMQQQQPQQQPQQHQHQHQLQNQQPHQQQFHQQQFHQPPHQTNIYFNGPTQPSNFTHQQQYPFQDIPPSSNHATNQHSFPALNGNGTNVSNSQLRRFQDARDLRPNDISILSSRTGRDQNQHASSIPNGGGQPGIPPGGTAAEPGGDVVSVPMSSTQTRYERIPNSQEFDTADEAVEAIEVTVPCPCPGGWVSTGGAARHQKLRTCPCRSAKIRIRLAPPPENGDSSGYIMEWQIGSTIETLHNLADVEDESQSSGVLQDKHRREVKSLLERCPDASPTTLFDHLNTMFPNDPHFGQEGTAEVMLVLRKHLKYAKRKRRGLLLGDGAPLETGAGLELFIVDKNLFSNIAAVSSQELEQVHSIGDFMQLFQLRDVKELFTVPIENEDVPSVANTDQRNELRS
jgi:hypothetical protein